MSNTPRNSPQFRPENEPFLSGGGGSGNLFSRENLEKCTSVNSGDLKPAESVIEISDSEISDEISDENDEETEEFELFSEDSDQYANEHFIEEKLTLETWFKDTQRKLAMLTEIFTTLNTMPSRNPDLITDDDYQCDRAIQVELMQRILEDIHCRVRRRNEKERTAFVILFDLYNLIANNDSSLLLDTKINSKLCTILRDWLGGETFRPKNFSKLKLFLKGYFMAKRETIPSIVTAWQKTTLFTGEKMKKIRANRTFLRTMYFDNITEIIDAKISVNAAYLPTLLEIGQLTSTKFKDFLEKFSIPYSGPYKKILNNGEMKIQYFLSSCSANADSIVNAGLPLYGVYEFRLSSLEARPDQAAKFVALLDKLPFWLNHVPPLFNESMDAVRNACTR